MGWRYAAHCICPIFRPIAISRIIQMARYVAVKLARPLERATTIYPDAYNYNGSRGTSEIGTFYPVYYKFWLGFGAR